MKSTLPIVILAAGSSARMRGADKLLEEVENHPLIARQARLARSVTDGPVLVALPPRPHPRYAALDGLDVTPIEVAEAAEGMNATLRAGFTALPADAPAAMVLLADMPALTSNDLLAVLNAVDLQSDRLIWRGVNARGEPGHPIAFSAALFGEIAKLRGDSGGREVVAMADGRIELILLPDSDARLDLDTPEDWAAWRHDRD